jgi:hypothetical protein
VDVHQRFGGHLVAKNRICQRVTRRRNHRIIRMGIDVSSRSYPFVSQLDLTEQKIPRSFKENRTPGMSKCVKSGRTRKTPYASTVYRGI